MLEARSIGIGDGGVDPLFILHPPTPHLDITKNQHRKYQEYSRKIQNVELNQPYLKH